MFCFDYSITSLTWRWNWTWKMLKSQNWNIAWPEMELSHPVKHQVRWPCGQKSISCCVVRTWYMLGSFDTYITGMSHKRQNFVGFTVHCYLEECCLASLTLLSTNIPVVSKGLKREMYECSLFVFCYVKFCTVSVVCLHAYMFWTAQLLVFCGIMNLLISKDGMN